MSKYSTDARAMVRKQTGRGGLDFMRESEAFTNRFHRVAGRRLDQPTAAYRY